MKDKSIFRRISISIVLLWLILLVIIPTLLLFIASFLGFDESHLILWKFSLESYGQLLSWLYVDIFWRSFKLAFLCTLLCFLIGYPAAFAIAQTHTRHKSILLILLMIPFWTSSLVRTYALIAIIKTKGLLNTLLLSMHIIHHPMQLLYTNTAVLIGCIYSLLPYMILPIYTNLEKLDHRLMDAAKDLGASWWMTLRKIILPLSMPGIVGGSLLVFLPAMTLFYIPVLLGGAHSLLLGNLIENQFLAMQDWPAGAVTSVILTIIMLVVVVFTRRFLGKTELH